MADRATRRAMTLTEKILLQHAVGWRRQDLAAGDVIALAVDWTLASEIAWKGMNKTYDLLGRPPLANKDRFYLALDHTVDRGTLATDPRVQQLVQLSRAAARELDLRYFYDANSTIMHTEFFRQLVRPGEVVLGADSHTSSHGGMGAFAIGLGGADVVAAMVRGTTWLQVPEAIRVHYKGRLPFGMTGKDVILKTLGELGRNTVALERTVEFTGDDLAELSTDFRFTIANMTAEFGGLNGIFPPDHRTLATMARRREAEFRTGGWWFEADADATYVGRYDISLDELGPQVAKPFSPDNVVAIDEVVGQPLDGCFIGACTTTEEELVLAALALERLLAGGAGPVASGQRLVVPGSVEISQRLGEAGLLAVYERAGFRIGDPGCSMCIGIASDRAQPGEIWLSSQNRNFHNRMGEGSIAWLASAVSVACSSIGMAIRDPRPVIAELDRDRLASLLAPRSSLPAVLYAEPQPSSGGDSADEGPSAPRAQRAAAVEGRAQVFGDHIDTDAMIAAEFCHLTSLEELGARAFRYFRPEFQQRVAAGEDVIVAGEGWGTGSSREQAVWALKGAGIKAIIARSFAFIHKRNLVNEALPFLIVHDDDFFRTVSDGAPIEVDLVSGVVRVGAQQFGSVPPAGLTQGILAEGGLVPYVQSRLATSDG